MSKAFCPFNEVFHPAFNKYYAQMGNPPSHVLIGRAEKELLDEEIRNAERFILSGGTRTSRRSYCGVEVLFTPDKESILYFFTKP